MSQNAIVKKVVHPGVVEVSLMRQMECGLSCSSCEDKQRMILRVTSGIYIVKAATQSCAQTKGQKIAVR